MPRPRRRSETLRWALLAALATGTAAVLAAGDAVDGEGADSDERMLFDFEDEAELALWSQLALPAPAPKDPPLRAELAPAHAASGKRSLKLTFSGGRWPALATAAVPGDWSAWESFHVEVVASRPCLVGFRVLQAKSVRGGDWDGAVSRWTKTEILKPGSNAIAAPLHPPNDYSIHKRYGKVERLEIFMYAPLPGETIHVDAIRLKKAPVAAAASRFRVLGSDLEVRDVQELGEKLAPRWSAPKTRSAKEVEDAFVARFRKIKEKNPRAYLAILRDGEPNYDPAHPERVYEGWTDAYWTSHGPDGMTIERAENRGGAAAHEIFMRHRSPLMRADLSSIPESSEVLAAELVIVRAQPPLAEHDPHRQPTMWAAEPCARAWEELEVNAYEYAKGTYWKAVGGRHYGEDPDFLPLFFAHGQGGGGGANVWDFTEAVRFWIRDRHPNHGFMLHGDGKDYILGHTREAEKIMDRPALMVIYERR